MAHKQPLVIALAGKARSGKDSFCQFLIDELNSRGFCAKRFALADSLKNKVREPLLELSGIDILNCPIEDKELVRDYLVAVGKIKRTQSQGTYWTTILEEKIANDPDVQFAIVSDVRYDVFEHDEVWWAQEKMKGILVHIARYKVVEPEFGIYGDVQDPKTGEWRQYIKAPNKDEEENEPRLQAKADYKVEWPTAPDLSKLKEHCNPYVQTFLNSFSPLFGLPKCKT